MDKATYELERQRVEKYKEIERTLVKAEHALSLVEWSTTRIHISASQGEFSTDLGDLFHETGLKETLRTTLNVLIPRLQKQLAEI